MIWKIARFQPQIDQNSSKEKIFTKHLGTQKHNISCHDVLMKAEGLIWRSMNNNEVFCNFVNRPEDENSTISAINRPKFVEMKHYTQNLGTQEHNISS